jgi:hypothetical protein
LLQEKENGGKQFKAIEVDGAKGYTVRQAFDPYMFELPKAQDKKVRIKFV